MSFDVYLLIVLLAFFHIKIPAFCLEISAAIASANVFLVMLMIGLKLEFRFSLSSVKHMLQIMGVRLGCAVVLSLIVFVLPVAFEARKVLILALFGPLVSVSSVYASHLGYQKDLIAQTTTLSIILSLVLLPVLIMLLG